MSETQFSTAQIVSCFQGKQQKDPTPSSQFVSWPKQPSWQNKPSSTPTCSTRIVSLHPGQPPQPKQSAVPPSVQVWNKTPKQSSASPQGISRFSSWAYCSGDTARLCSKYRPNVPIITVTRNFNTSRACHLNRGVYPFLYSKPRPHDPTLWQEDVDTRLHWAMKYASLLPPNLTCSEAMKLKLLEADDIVVAVQGWRGGHGNSNTLRVHLPRPPN